MYYESDRPMMPLRKRIQVQKNESRCRSSNRATVEPIEGAFGLVMRSEINVNGLHLKINWEEWP